MKNILFISFLIFFAKSWGQTVSLETMAQYEIGTYPQVTYVKDVNNLLNKYTGIWKGTLDGKSYEFNFIKKENFGFEDSVKKDRLIGRLKITNANGMIEFDNFNRTDDDLVTRFSGFNFQKDLKVYLMRFAGGKIGCIDYGFVYMWIKPETPNQMGINFHPDNDTVTEDCNNFKTTLPDNKIIHLTRQ